MMDQTDRERARLAARERFHRREVRSAARQLQRPFHWIAQVRSTFRRALPLLPYAGVLLTAVVVTAQLRRGGLRPVVMLTTAIDVWRLWALLSGEPGGSAQRAIAYRSGRQ